MNLRKDHYWLLKCITRILVVELNARVQMVLMVACLSAVTAVLVKPRNGGYLS